MRATGHLAASSWSMIALKEASGRAPTRRCPLIKNVGVPVTHHSCWRVQLVYRSPAGVLLREQMIGGPVWLETDRFDIEAKIVGDTRAISSQQTWLMVQALSEDRFQLKVHGETRQLPMYNLAVAKRGVRMNLD